MKSKSSKILILALAIATILCATFAVMTSANEAETKPEIISKNMLYSDRYSIMYAVAAETVAEGPVTLNIYREYPVANSIPVGTYKVAAPQDELIGGVTRSVYVFTGFGIGAQDFADKVYAQAIDKAGNKSDVVEYSVVEYFLERLYGGYEIDSIQKNLYETGLAFGAAAQDRYAANDPIRVNDYKYIRVVGGTVNGVEKGMFLKGDVLTLALNEAVSQGAFFFGWNNVNGETNAYANNEFTLSESAVITADVAIGGSLGYFEKFGGYDMEDATSHWTWSVKNTAKIIRDGSNTNGDSSDVTANGLFLNTVDGNKVWELIKGSGNGNLARVYFDNTGTSDYIIAEANVYFSDCTTVANDKEYAILGVTTDNHATDGGQLSLRAFTDDDGVAYFSYFDMQLIPGNWYNLGWIYSKSLGMVTYYLNGREVGSVAVANNDLKYSDSYIALTGEAKGASVRIDNVYTGLGVEHLADSDEYATFNDSDTSIVSGFENKSGSSALNVVELDGEKVLKLDKEKGGEDRVWFNREEDANATKFVFETKMYADVTNGADMYFEFMNNSTLVGVYEVKVDNGTMLLSDYYKLSGVGKNSFSNTTYYIGGSQWIDIKLEGYVNTDGIWCVEYWINGTLMQTSTCAHWQSVRATDITAVRFRTLAALEADIYFDDVKAAQIAE